MLQPMRHEIKIFFFHILCRIDVGLDLELSGQVGPEAETIVSDPATDTGSDPTFPTKNLYNFCKIML
jgi:hypothetical protein